MYNHQYNLGDIEITWLGHATFMVKDPRDTIYFDPFVIPQNPEPATFIFITNCHDDHSDLKAIEKIQTKKTIIVSSLDCVREKLTGHTFSIDPGENESYKWEDMEVEMFDAYNEYYEKGKGGGILLTIGNKKIYHAGDTGLIDEFAFLPDNIDVLLIPIGGKFTMDINEAAEAVKIIKPKVVIPMHYNSDAYGIEGINADPEEFKELLKDTNVKVIILKPKVNPRAS